METTKDKKALYISLQQTWIDQAEEVSKNCPSFNLNKALQHIEFRTALLTGHSVAEAYMILLYETGSEAFKKCVDLISRMDDKTLDIAVNALENKLF